jgi:hypothetical protein
LRQQIQHYGDENATIQAALTILAVRMGRCGSVLSNPLGGHAAIYTLYASRFAVMALDALEEILERGRVSRIACEHLVDKRKALGVTTKAITTCTQSGR